MKVLTRRNAALKNTAVTSRAIRASVIHKKNADRLGKQKNSSITTSTNVKKEKEASPNTKALTKENVKPENTGKKRGRPFKNPPKKEETRTNGVLTHTAEKTQTKETTRKNNDETKVNQKISNGKTRNSNVKKSIIDVKAEAPSSNSTFIITSVEEQKPLEHNNNVTVAFLTKGPFSPNSSVGDSGKKSERKYQCGICMKVFLGSNDLRKHLRIHR